MGIIQLFYYAILTIVLQMGPALAGSGVCSCGTNSCTNVQVGYHTFVEDYCYKDAYISSESACYNKVLESDVWQVNYRPPSSECYVGTCDTTSRLTKSEVGRIMFRKTCSTTCLNFTIEYHANCWTMLMSPAVAMEYPSLTETECSRKCLPPSESCLAVYYTPLLSSSKKCAVYTNIDVTSTPYCIPSSTSVFYYISCLQCPIPTDISDGNVTYSDMTVGSTATYNCQTTGYQLVGSATVTCEANLQWSTPLPTCQLVDCNSPPNVTHATASSTNTLAPSISTTYGSSVTYNCISSYTLIGSSSVSCLSNGSWESPSPACQKVDCNTPPNVTDATVSPADPSALTISTIYGSTITYTCNTGYTLTGSPNISCLASGSWESPLPTCQIIDCGDPPNVTDATVDVLNTTYLSTVSYTCVSYHNMVGPATVSCLDDGQWGPTFPVCNIVDCQTPLPNVTNSTVSFTTTTFGSTATYTCFTNHTQMGTPTITCQGNGVWSQPSVMCFPKGNSVSVPPKPLYVTSCLCRFGSLYANMTEDEIIAELISETMIDTKETTLAQSALICRQDNRTSSVIAGVVGVTSLSLVFGIMFCLDLLTLCKHFNKITVKK